MKTYYIAACLVLYSDVANFQRLPPGVPSQQYQQPPYQQQYQPQQFQQSHQHFEPQPNPPQFQNPTHQQMHHQQPVQPGVGHQNVHHDHGQAHQQARVLNPANIEHEKEHIAEHFDIPLDTKDMTTEQLQFHYFRMHDADKNNMLDGCELIKSLIHWHEQGSKGGENNIEERIFKDEELVTLIDPILNMDDINHDGYIDYPEFIQAQRKAAAAGAPSKH